MGFAPRRLVTGAAAGLATLVLAAAGASGAAAAPRPITFEVFIGDTCVFGTAANNSFLKVIIKDRNGNLKGRGAVEADAQGNWQACLNPGSGVMLPGDTINARVFDTSNSRTFTVPVLTGKIDRGTNVVSGKAPSGASIELEAFDFRWDMWGDSYDVTTHVTAANGSWSHDFDADNVDIRGGASVVIRWKSAGDEVRVGRFQIAPYITLQLGRDDVAGASRANGPIAISLRDGAGALLSAANGVGSYSDTTFLATFADSDGEPYTVRGGEQLSAPALGGQSAWRIPTVGATANLTADTVSGTCFPNGRVLALAQDRNGLGYGLDKGNAASNGRFTVNLHAQVDIKKGFRLVVLCYSPDGDEIVQETTAR